MSLYNMVNGMNALMTVFLSPFLPLRADLFPRFRDIFLEVNDMNCDFNGGDIFVYTRMGGGNRDCWENNETDCNCPAHLADKIENTYPCLGSYDDEFDCTYRTFVFRVIENLKDFKLIKEGKINETSKEYKLKLIKMFADNEKISERLKQELSI